MKVLFVAHSSDLSGGANRSLLSLIECLERDWGVEPCVLLPEAEGDLQRCCKRMGIAVYSARYHTCCTVYQRNYKDTLRFAKLIFAPLIDRRIACKAKKILPDDLDLIYTNERMIAIGGYIAKHMRIPHIWHIRSFAEKNDVHYPPQWFRKIDWYSDRIVLISKSVFNEFEKKLDRGKLRLVYNGIEFERYAIDVKIPHDSYNILLTGRIVPPKGQSDAIEALRILAESGFDKLVLHFAGQVPQYGDQAYYHDLNELVKKYKLEERVRFLGGVKDITALRQQMDLELVCSWHETFGRTTIEAMCAGIPVIGSNSGGTPELIRDGVNGLLYEPKNPRELSEKIKWMVLNGKQATMMGLSGKAMVKKNFSIENTARNVYNVIKEVCLK